MRARSSVSLVSGGTISAFHRNGGLPTWSAIGWPSCPLLSTIWTFAPSKPRPASNAGTTIMPTIKSGHRIVITRNHLDRTRSMNSRFAITQVSRNGVLPALGDCSRRADALDEDLMKRRHDDHEQAEPDV